MRTIILTIIFLLLCILPGCAAQNDGPPVYCLIMPCIPGPDTPEPNTPESSDFNNSIRDVTVIASFDFKNNDLSQGFSSWSYSPIGENQCNVYNGTSQEKLCGIDANGESLSIARYYSGYNTDHMGWLRWGYMDSEDVKTIDQGALKLTYTGGAYDDGGSVAFSGLEVRGKTQYTEHIAQGDNPYSDLILPGDETIYFKTKNKTTPFETLQNKNRLSVWVLMPQHPTQTYGNQAYSPAYRRPDYGFAFYPFIEDGSGGHYYHQVTNIPMGNWTHIVFDSHPTHFNGGDNNPYSYYRSGGYEYPGNGVKYFNNIMSFALRATIVSDTASPATMMLDKIESYRVDYENDETINSLGVGYNNATKTFDIGFEDKYRCLSCNSKYEVRYSYEPISNKNYSEAKLAVVTNFNRGKNNTEGIIYKPNAGYSQIWAGLNLQDADAQELTEGKKIYFAVKDISDRSNLEDRDDYDLEEVNVPGVGNIKRIDLVKTIQYKIFPMP